MSPAQILHVAAFGYPSRQGSQVYVKGLTEALKEAGYQVVLACYGHGDGGEQKSVELIRGPRVFFDTQVGSGPHPLRLLLDVLLAFRLAFYLRDHPVDLIHGHNVEGPIIAYFARLFAWKKIPILYNPHTVMERELPTYKSFRSYQWLGRWIGRWMDRAAFAVSDASVALSESGAAAFKKAGYGTIPVVFPGVHQDELKGGDGARARKDWDLGERPWVVYTGNVDGYQDFPILCEAMTLVRNAGLLVLTHGGLEEVWAQIDQVGLDRSRCRVIGDPTVESLRNGLIAGNMAVVPRRYCAGFPMKLLNSVALGVTTIAAEGCRQPIDGLVIVPNGNVKALAAVITDLMEDSARCEALGQRSAQAAGKQWSWSNRAQETGALYEKILHEY
jgi:glycosyltransferase involved in cell wall biosynthesis